MNQLSDISHLLSILIKLENLSQNHALLVHFKTKNHFSCYMENETQNAPSANKGVSNHIQFREQTKLCAQISMIFLV